MPPTVISIRPLTFSQIQGRLAYKFRHRNEGKGRGYSLQKDVYHGCWLQNREGNGMNNDFQCQSRPGEDGSGPSLQDAACLCLSDGLERQRETLTKFSALQESGPGCSYAFMWFWVPSHRNCHRISPSGAQSLHAAMSLLSPSFLGPPPPPPQLECFAHSLWFEGGLTS